MTRAKRTSPGRRGSLAAVCAAGIALAAVGLWPGQGGAPAKAQGSGAQGSQQGRPGAAAESCRPRPGQIGVSRVVEIDTTRGPRFGLQQYPEHDFLRDGEVVLTFDDGPQRRYTRMVLEALAAHCTQATFYMVGQMALGDPEVVREVGRAGHTVGVHTWSHKNLRGAGSPNATREIELGISAVQKALGQPVAPFFRFPYLADSQAMQSHLASRDFGIFSIDVDSRDFRTKDPRTMQRTVLDMLEKKRKGILLFHDIQFSTATGIRGLLDELAKRGFKVVHTVPKTPALSQPSYDAMAEAEHVRRHRVAAAQPMATRAVVWPMTPPGVPIEQYQPQSVTSATSTRAAIRPATARPFAPPPAAGPVPPQPVVPVAAPLPAPQPPAQAPPSERPALRGSAEDEDWRRRVFQQ